jgi:hypothetical protein
MFSECFSVSTSFFQIEVSILADKMFLGSWVANKVLLIAVIKVF